MEPVSFKPSFGPLRDLELSWVLHTHSTGGGVRWAGVKVRKDGSVYICPTCTLDSGKLIFSATSSRMKMSGYRVLANSASSTSSCARVNVVLSRRCFRGVAAGQEAQGPLGWGSSFSVIGVSVGVRLSPPPHLSTPRVLCIRSAGTLPMFSPPPPRPRLLRQTGPLPGETPLPLTSEIAPIRAFLRKQTKRKKWNKRQKARTLQNQPLNLNTKTPFSQVKGSPRTGSSNWWGLCSSIFKMGAHFTSYFSFYHDFTKQIWSERKTLTPRKNHTSRD